MISKLKINKRIVLSMILLCSPLAQSADYDIYQTMPNTNYDDLAFDDTGNLYVSHAGSFTGGELRGASVQKIAAEGLNVTQAVQGLSGPLGIDFDSDKNMYIANYNTGQITKVTESGVQSTLVDLGQEGLACGIVSNSNAEIFAASCTSNTVYKISRDGTSEVWVSGNGIASPSGITIDEEENIYVANYDNGRVFKIDSNKNITELASAAAVVSHITYSNGVIYGTLQRQNAIYQIPVDGSAGSMLPGSDSAGLSSPNGITASNDGTKLYVANFNNAQIIVVSNLTTNPTEPQTQEDTVSTEINTAIEIDILANDNQGSTLDPSSVEIVTAAGFGTTEINVNNGVVTYTPAVDFSGTDSFDYTVRDTNGNLSEETKVTISVANPIPEPTTSGSSGGGSFGYLSILLLLLGARKVKLT